MAACWWWDGRILRITCHWIWGEQSVLASQKCATPPVTQAQCSSFFTQEARRVLIFQQLKGKKWVVFVLTTMEICWGSDNFSFFVMSGEGQGESLNWRGGYCSVFYYNLNKTCCKHMSTMFRKTTWAREACWIRFALHSLLHPSSLGCC